MFSAPLARGGLRQQAQHFGVIRFAVGGWLDALAPTQGSARADFDALAALHAIRMVYHSAPAGVVAHRDADRAVVAAHAALDAADRVGDDDGVMRRDGAGVGPLGHPQELLEEAWTLLLLARRDHLLPSSVTMPKKMGFGIIGCGGIAFDAHIPSIAE